MNISLIAIAVFIIDRLSKLYIVDNFTLGQTIPVIPNVFHITYILNRGAAFGLFAEQQLVFIGIVLTLIALLIYFRKRINNSPKYVQVGIGLLLGGAIGNAYDRAVQQSVIDFFDFRIWPIFNIADIAICLGVALIIKYLWEEN